MIPDEFEYAAPGSLAEAISLLSSRGEGAKVIAGGQSLIPLLKLRLASPTILVDINRIPGLDYISESEGFLRIGALTRMADVEASDLVRRKYEIIHEASLVIADPLVRNLGTLGGNLSHGDPANDMPAVMLAMGGEFIATGRRGARAIDVNDFFLDTFTTALGHDEILTEIRVPLPPPRTGGSYLKLEQKAGDFATAGVAVQISLTPRGECQRVGIGLTSVGPTAIKAKEAEQYLVGTKPTDRKVEETVARLASGASDPVSDIRGTSAYKRKVVALLVTRAVRTAYHKARSGGAD
jgi:aerobic carbon-monoxide dehydrogenase medium subunit